MVDLVDDPPSADPHSKQTAATGEGLDLSRRGIIAEIAQGAAHPLADHLIECLVLLAGTRSQLDFVGGHPRLTLGKLSVNVGEPVGAPVVSFPLGECFFRGGEIGSLFERLDSGGPGRGDTRRHDRGDPSALRVSKVDDLTALGRVVGSTGQGGGVIDRQLGHMISIGPPRWMTKRSDLQPRYRRGSIDTVEFAWRGSSSAGSLGTIWGPHAMHRTEQPAGGHLSCQPG
jgi:hypothetical protein